MDKQESRRIAGGDPCLSHTRSSRVTLKFAMQSAQRTTSIELP